MSAYVRVCCQLMDECARELRRELKVKVMSSDDCDMLPCFPLTLTGSEFQRVGSATGKALVLLVVQLREQKIDQNWINKVVCLSCRSEKLMCICQYMKVPYR